MTTETTLPPVALSQKHADRLKYLTKRKIKADADWREEVRAAVADGASLREVAEAAGVSHTAVKFIAHGRPT